MKDLIEALNIFLKYANDDYSPTNCSHDELAVCCGISPQNVSKIDKDKLSDLGFEADESEDYFYSFRFGSC